MKKLIPILLAVCMLTALMAATASADDHSQTTAVPFVDETTNPDVVFPDGSVPAQSERLDGIRLPLHALVLAMWEHELPYDIQSAPFVWNALYYALSLYGEADDRAQLTEEALLLPSEAVHDFSRALFAHLEELPALPPDEEDFVSYESASDTYRLALGDFAQTQLQMGVLTAQADGSFVLEGTLLAPEDNTPLCFFRVTLQENDTMFGFSVTEISLY